MKKHQGVFSATRKQHGMVEYRGEMWRSASAMARAYGTQMDTLLYHTNTGKTFQEAMDFVLANGTAVNPPADLREKFRAFLFRGVYYTSPSACATAFGFSAGSLSYWRKRGYSAEQAMEQLLAA